ncbi:MAG: tail fiber domain-containing protein [Vibrio splendidus]
MQKYHNIESTKTLTDSREPLLDNDMATLTCNAGTVFPVAYKYAGMLCYRTDQKKLYQLRDLDNWVMIFDLTQSAVSKQYVDNNFARAVGSYASLRAQATTKADIGLSNIPNAVTDDYNTDNPAVLPTSRALHNVYIKVDANTKQIEKNRLAISGKAALAGNINQIFRAMSLESNSTVVAKGDIIAYGALTTSSDIRLKTDIRKIKNPLARVRMLNGVTFTQKRTGQKSTGLIAQDVQLSMPEAIRKGGDGLMSVTYGNLVGLLVECVKELDTRLAKLEA